MKQRIKRQIIQSLIQGDSSFYEVLSFQDASIKEFWEILQELKDDKSITLEDGKITLKEKNIYEKLKPLKTSPCDICKGTGYNLNSYFSNLLDRWIELTKNRPRANPEYDQGFISPEGVIKRVAFIYERGDLWDNNIFIVGDDDLLSLALGMTGIPKEIQVCEIDERLVDFINEISQKQGLPVKANILDVQDPLPESYQKKYDVFITDPVETLPGFTLFISRGVSALKGIGTVGYFGLTTLEASRKKWFEIEKRLLQMGFVITDIRRKFNTYPLVDISFGSYEEKLPIFRLVNKKSDCDWYTSSLFRIEAINEPEPLIKERMVIEEKVYKDDESLATPY